VGAFVSVVLVEVFDDVDVSEGVEDSDLALATGEVVVGVGVGVGTAVAPDTAGVPCGLGSRGTVAVGFNVGGTGTGPVFPGSKRAFTITTGGVPGPQPGGKLPVSKPWKVLYPLAPAGIPGIGLELKW
jgi:hypothetical protein